MTVKKNLNLEDKKHKSCWLERDKDTRVLDSFYLMTIKEDLKLHDKKRDKPSVYIVLNDC